MNLRAALRVLFDRDDQIMTSLGVIYSTLTVLSKQLSELTKEFQVSTSTTDQNFANLAAQVTQTQTVEASAVTLIQGIAAQLAAAIAAANNGDSAALPALQQQLATSATALSAAIAANTPAAPPAPST